MCVCICVCVPVLVCVRGGSVCGLDKAVWERGGGGNRSVSVWFLWSNNGDGSGLEIPFL